MSAQWGQMLGTVLLPAYATAWTSTTPMASLPRPREVWREKPALSATRLWRISHISQPDKNSSKKLLVFFKVGSALLIVLTGALNVFHCTGHADPREENVQRVVFFSPDPIPQQESLNTLPQCAAFPGFYFPSNCMK